MSDWDMNGETTRAGYAAQIAYLQRRLAGLLKVRGLPPHRRLEIHDCVAESKSFGPVMASAPRPVVRTVSRPTRI